MVRDVCDAIDDQFSDHLKRVQTWVRQPSISADGEGMPEMADLVAESIRELGGTAKIVPTDGHPIVQGLVDVEAAATVLIYGMYDVQPVAGEDWMVDPFAGEVVDLEEFGPCVVSRGVMNSKGPLANFFSAMNLVRRKTGSLPANLVFVVEGEEELGSPSLPGFVRAHKDELWAHAALFPFYSQDRTGKIVLFLGVKGIVFLELIAKGGAWGGPTTRDIHGMNAGWFHSPAWTLAQLLSTMMSWDQKQILVDDLCDFVAPPLPEDLRLLELLQETVDPEVSLKDYEVERFKYEVDDVDLFRRYLLEPSLNINGMSSGDIGSGMKTLLPYEAHAKVDVRLVPDMKPDQVLSALHRHIERRGFADKVEVRVQTAYPWSKGNLDDLANGAINHAYRQFGLPVEVWPLVPGAAPLYLFTKELGMSLAMGGLGHGGRQHSSNEYAIVDGMRLFEHSAVHFIYEIAARAR